MSRQVSPSDRSGLWPAAGDTDLGRVASDRLPPSPPAEGDRAPATRATRCDGGRGAGAGDPATPAGQPVPRRGLPQAMGATALCRHPLQPAPRPAADARARPAGASARGPPAWLARPRRHHHHRAGRSHVGHRPDLRHDRRGPGGGVHCGRDYVNEPWPTLLTKVGPPNGALFMSGFGCRRGFF